MSLYKRQIALRFTIVILKDCQIPLEKMDRLICGFKRKKQV